MPHTYRDPRTNGIPEKVFEIISSDEIYELTAIQTMQINSLYQLYSIKLCNESLLKETETLLFMPDLFNYFLTGEKKSEYTIASTSQLMNVNNKFFDKKIFSALGLPLNIMAPIVMPGTVMGKLLPEIASEIGIKEIDVVAVGSHDTASAVAAVPAKDGDWAYLSSGTWSLIGIEINKPIIDASVKNEFTNEGGVGGNFRYLHNTIGMWIIQELKRGWNSDGEILNFNDIIDLASTASGDLPSINFDDKIFLNPPDMVEAIKNYCIRTEQKCPKKKGEFARVVFESLASKYRIVLEKIENLSNKKIEKLHIVGDRKSVV